jgi:hypothetical protein
MAAKIKEDPPELKSKVDSVDAIKPAIDEYALDPEDAPKETFKEAPEPAPEKPAVSAGDFALLMEQNRILMAKLEELSAGKEEAGPVKDGKPVLDPTKPIIYQRSEGAAWKEQNGNRFSQKDTYIGPVE